jgi:hypothetical protein
MYPIMPPMLGTIASVPFSLPPATPAPRVSNSREVNTVDGLGGTGSSQAVVTVEESSTGVPIPSSEGTVSSAITGGPSYVSPPRSPPASTALVIGPTVQMTEGDLRAVVGASVVGTIQGVDVLKVPPNTNLAGVGSTSVPLYFWLTTEAGALGSNYGSGVGGVHGGSFTYESRPGGESTGAALSMDDFTGMGDSSKHVMFSGSEATSITGTCDSLYVGTSYASSYRKSSGKRYCEFTIMSDGGLSASGSVGMVDTTYFRWFDQISLGVANGYAYLHSGHKSHKTAATLGVDSPAAVAYGPTYAVGDVIGMLADLDTGELEFTKNGTALGVAYTGVTGGYSPALMLYQTASIKLNVGGDAWVHTPPGGYTGWIS